MFLNARTDKGAPLTVLPLVLRIGAYYMHLLAYVAVVSEHLVVKTVVVVFRPYGQVALHLAARVRETILQSGVGGQIGASSICIKVLSGAEVALASYVLYGRIGGYEVAVVVRVPVEGE